MQSITDKLMSLTEFRNFLGVSERTVQRDHTINCLIRVYLHGRTFFNRQQVIAHYERVAIGIGCDGECKSVLKLTQGEPEIQRSFRRKKQKD